jgi:hypothetical protein
MSFIQIVMCVVVAINTPRVDKPIYTTMALSSVTLAIFWIDTISDGLLVIAQRKDPRHGSEDL